MRAHIEKVEVLGWNKSKAFKGKELCLVDYTEIRFASNYLLTNRLLLCNKLLRYKVNWYYFMRMNLQGLMM